MINSLKAIAVAAFLCRIAFGVNAESIRNIVLVHGAFADVLDVAARGAVEIEQGTGVRGAGK